jgi:hypothetical protein
MQEQDLCDPSCPLWFLEHCFSKVSADGMSQFFERSLISPVPHPQAVLFRLDQPSLSQDRHVVGNRRLRERNVVLHVTGAHAYTLSDGALALLLQQPQDLYPRRVGYGLEGQDELFVG